MFDRQYFEAVLPDQIREMGRSPTVTLRLRTGNTYDVWSVLAVRDQYVVLKVHPPEGEQLPERREMRQQQNPGRPPWIFDQVTIPYRLIVSVYVTARQAPEGDEERPIGFHAEDEDLAEEE